MGNVRVILPEIRETGRRLGRHINHDPRSKAFRVVARSVTPKSVRWERHGPILDQGSLGSCVANAGTGMLMCDPFWGTLSGATQKALSNGPAEVELWAVQLYREVTAIDPFPGQWEPDDTGSDGLSLGKLLKKKNLVSGYQHVMDVEGAHAAIQKGPFPFGVTWMSNMDQPNSEGIVQATGYSRGGHEILMTEYDAARDLWWMDNSWTVGFGKDGRFALDTPNLQKLMDLQADGTPMVPADMPAPEPKPELVPVSFTAGQFQALDVWSGRLRRWWPQYQCRAAKAWQAATK